MICKHCGAEVEDGVELCPQCGQPPEEAAEDLNPEAVTPPLEETSTGETTEDLNPETVTPPTEETPTAEATDELNPEAVTPPTEETPTGEATEDLNPEAVTPPMEETPPEETADEASPDVPNQPEPPKRKEPVWLFAILGVVVVAAIAILIFCLTRGKKETPNADPLPSSQTEEPSAAPNTPGSPEEPSQPESPADEKAGTYTVPNEDITAEMAGSVAASCGGRNLSNTELSYYYWNQIYSWANAYGDYLSIFLDLNTPLSEQSYPDDPERSWESFLLDAALDTFHQTTAIVEAAEKAGFSIDSENAQYLELLPDTLAGNAQRLELNSADEFLQQLYGPYADVESYTRFVRDSLISYGYLNELFAGITYTPEEIGEWFDENQSRFEEMGLTRDEPNMVNVRHILIKPVAQDETGDGELTDQDWANARNRAGQLLSEWQDGEATEDAFALLASENSDDTGSQGTGGLYEGIYPGEMVAAFNDWCFDESRSPGDTGIVETEYGYHIMYFSATMDHAHWYEEAEKDYLSNRQQEILDGLTADYPLQANYDKIVLMESNAFE